MKIFLPVMFCQAAFAACPANLPPGVTCTSSGLSTDITLSQPALLTWSNFQVGAGEQLNFHGDFAVVNQSSNPAQIAGSVTAASAFGLISPKGIQVDATGSITASQIVLSTLRSSAPAEMWSGQPLYTLPNSPALTQLAGQLSATQCDLVLLGHKITNDPGSLAQATGHLQLLTTRPNQSIQKNSTGAYQKIAATSSNDTEEKIINNGTLRGNRITILSEGYLSNAGEIRSSGPNNSVHMQAGVLVHENKPGALISSSQFTYSANAVVLAGPIVDPDEGANPGTISTSIELSDLSKDDYNGKPKVTLQPSQYASRSKDRITIPSAVPKKNAPVLASRSTTSSRTSAQKMSQAPQKKKSLFFGRVIEK
jgi:filamentous hemagglutinin family protein